MTVSATMQQLQALDRAHHLHPFTDFHDLAARGCDSVCIPTPDGLVLGIKR